MRFNSTCQTKLYLGILKATDLLDSSHSFALFDCVFSSRVVQAQLFGCFFDSELLIDDQSEELIFLAFRHEPVHLRAKNRSDKKSRRLLTL